MLSKFKKYWQPFELNIVSWTLCFSHLNVNTYECHTISYDFFHKFPIIILWHVYK